MEKDAMDDFLNPGVTIELIQKYHIINTPSNEYLNIKKQLSKLRKLI